MTQFDDGIASALREAAHEADVRVRRVELENVLREGSRRVRRRRRQRRMAETLALVAAAVLVFVVPMLSRNQAVTTTLPRSKTPSASPVVTAAQLASGRWAAMPSAPIAPRGGAAVVWTGRELLVWGGSSGPTGPLRGDGAAYNPATNRWRVLPAAPLPPTAWASAVWTGSEMVIFGGYTDESLGSFKLTNDAAAYDPTTNRWQVLPPAPLSPRADAIALWTGDEVIVLAGRPAVFFTPSQGSNQWNGDWTYGDPPTYGDGAALDPSTGTWNHIAAPVPPRGHQLAFQTVVQTGDELLAFSLWSEFHSLGNGTEEGVYGRDLFAYDLRSGDWRTVGDWPDVPARPDSVTVPEEALSTAGGVIVRGAPYECLFCNLVPPPEVTDLYDPARNSSARIAPDPLATDNLISAWTGDALFSFDPSSQSGATRPGAASLYDPSTGRWSLLPTAPLGCPMSGIPTRVVYSYSSPIWTGHQILIYCPQFGKPPTAPSGLVYAPGRSGTARAP